MDVKKPGTGTKSPKSAKRRTAAKAATNKGVDPSVSSHSGEGTTSYIDAFVEAIRASLNEQGKTLQGVDVSGWANSVARSLPKDDESNPLMEAVGPYYDTRGLQEWLGLSRQALRKRVQAHKILACKTDDNVLLYPVWQFRDDGTVVEYFDEVLTILASGMDAPWGWGAWLTAVLEDELDGLSAAEWLYSGRDPEAVKTLAREDAASWAA